MPAASQSRKKKSPTKRSDPPKLRVMDGYIRVSSVAGRAGDSFISPDVQREKIRGWAQLRGVEIAAFHEDLDETGGNLDRPGLNDLLDRLRAGQTQGIVVARLDRLSRAGVADALKLVEEIHDLGGELAAVDQNIDPTTEMGEFVLTIMLALARMERRRIAESWNIAQQKAIERGVHITPRPPYGYTKDPETKLLVPHPEQAPVVQRIFRERAAGQGLSDITRRLSQDKIPTATGQPFWQRQSVLNILRNRVYLGEARRGPEMVNPNAHPPLVDEKTFEQAEKQLGTAYARHPLTDTLDPPLLTGMLRCANCRNVLKPDSIAYKGRRERQYRCRAKYEGGRFRCPRPVAILGPNVEAYVEKKFFELVDTVQAHASRRRQDPAMQALADRVTTAERALESFRDSSDILLALGPEKFAEGLERYSRDYMDALQELRNARQANGSEHIPPVADLRKLWPEMEIMEKRALLRAIFDAVVVRTASPGTSQVADRLHFIHAGDLDPAQWPRRRSGIGPLPPFVFPEH